MSTLLKTWKTPMEECYFQWSCRLFKLYRWYQIAKTVKTEGENRRFRWVTYTSQPYFVFLSQMLIVILELTMRARIKYQHEPKRTFCHWTDFCWIWRYNFTFHKIWWYFCLRLGSIHIKGIFNQNISWYCFFLHSKALFALDVDARYFSMNSSFQ